MRPTRFYLVIALMTLALCGVYWAVRAQEGPLFAPPPVLTSDNGEKKAPAKVPHQTQPLREKKPVDATLIVPAEVYDVPRPLGPSTESRIGFATEELPALVQTQGVVVPPQLPPLSSAEPKVEKGPGVLPPLPAVETNPPLPLPVIDPIKVLLPEPKEKETPKKGPIVELPMQPPTIVMPERKAAPPTVIVPSVMPEPVANEKPGAFVRIKQEVSPAPDIVPSLDQRGLEYPRLDLDKNLPLLQPIGPAGIRLSGLANLQTPSITIEKRGQPNLRRDQSADYQLVVRNLGPGPAQQVRIEDELPASVRIVTADPMPAIQGNKAVWLLAALNANQEQVLRLSLQASADTEIPVRLSAHVAAVSQKTVTALGPRNDLAPMTIQVTGPGQVAVGKPAVILVHVANQSNQPLTGMVLHGSLPAGLVVRVKGETGMIDEREISGEVDETIPPGESKTLKMPASAVKAGRWTVAVKVTTKAGHEASATTNVEVVAETLHLQQPSATRLYMGRDGDLRIDVTNHTSKPMRNVTVADRLPDGFDFVDANSRGLYQANSRMVYWVIDQLPADKTQTLVVRVNGARAGEHKNVVYAKADGVPEMQSAGIVTLEGIADLTMRVTERDNPLELGKETVYEIKVQNPGNVPAGNVQLQVQFPAGLAPKNAQGKTRFSIDRQSIIFEPIASLEPQGELIFQVWALAQSAGDQRVRFAVASEEVRVPIQREISTRVYSDRNP